MREKYIDETVGSYYISSDGSDMCSIATSSTNDDVVPSIKRDYANILIDERDKLVDALIFVINKHGENAYEIFSEMREKFYSKETIKESDRDNEK